jgi:hypothetical protein
MQGELLESVEFNLLEEMGARLLQDDETRVHAATHLARRLQAEVVSHRHARAMLGLKAGSTYPCLPLRRWTAVTGCGRCFDCYAGTVLLTISCCRCSLSFSTPSRRRLQ